MARAFLILASLVSVVFSLPNVARDMLVHERRDSAPPGFVHVGAAPPDHVLSLRLGIAQNNFAGLESALYAVSTPGSAQYGQHLSKEAVQALIAPSASTVNDVKSWLSSHNLQFAPTTPAGDWIKVTLTVAQANTLLDANFATFKHQATGEQTIRTLSYSVPSSLKNQINFVHPTTTFPVKPFGKQLSFKPRSPSKRAASTNVTSDAAPASCAFAFTPVCLQELYGIPATKATQSSNILAVSGFIEEFANQGDLRTFITNFRTDLPASTTFTTALIDGGQNPQGSGTAGIEANLDTQYTVGIAGGVPVQFVSVGEENNDGIDGFLDIIEFLLGETPIPTVLSTSYSFNENELPFSLANQVCNAYAQLGAQGTSILFSSGDGGVSGGQSSSCNVFVPTFPSTCPFVTSIGATSGLSPEVAADFSSGGFSNFFAIPDYQSAVVRAFVAGLGSTYAGLFNPAGRAFPDVSAAGVDVEIVWQGEFGTVDGTSCSTPILAGTFALLNDELISAGKSPLGFLNPFLYANQDIFTDITSGTNPGCGTAGFTASTGWDPVTGVGSPIFANLRTAAGL